MKSANGKHQDWVITLNKPEPHRVVWHGSSPIALGHPLRFVLERRVGGFRLRDLQKIETKELTEAEALKAVEAMGISLSIQPARDLKSKISTPTLLVLPTLKGESAASWDKIQVQVFKKSAAASSGALLLLLLISFVLPTPEPKKDEIIPPQFAKLLMSPALKAAQKAQIQAQAAQNDKGGKAAGVVQAFRSQAVQKSAKTLLQGAMSKLLMRSALTAPSSAKVTQLFSAVQNTRAAEAPRNTELKALQMAALGGQAGAQGVGYGAGEKAGVASQGSGFVALDTTESLVEEGLSKDEVGRVIHSHLAEVRYCYEAAILKNPNVQGKLMVDFTIASAGKVNTAKVKDSSVTDQTLDQCLIAKLRQWQFPKPKGGVTVAVTYPFIFKTLGR